MQEIDSIDLADVLDGIATLHRCKVRFHESMANVGYDMLSLSPMQSKDDGLVFLCNPSLVHKIYVSHELSLKDKKRSAMMQMLDSLQRADIVCLNSLHKILHRGESLESILVDLDLAGINIKRGKA